MQLLWVMPRLDAKDLQYRRGDSLFPSPHLMEFYMESGKKEVGGVTLTLASNTGHGIQ